MATNTSNAAPSDDRGGVAAAGATGKQRWHAPAVKRLDIDLTAGNRRNSNSDTSGQFGTGNS